MVRAATAPQPSQSRVPRASSVAERLRAVEEPLDLRRRLRVLVAEDPAAAHDEAVRLVAQRLWRRWKGEHALSGVRAGSVRNWVAGGERELWLWIAGDRSWEHVIDGLAGRVSRRLPGKVGPKGSNTPTS